MVLAPVLDRKANLSLYKVLKTDAAGHFNFQGVPPGEYKVSAGEDLQPGQHQYPDFVKENDLRATPINVEAGKRTDTNLRILSRGNPRSSLSLGIEKEAVIVICGQHLWQLFEGGYCATTSRY